MENTTIEQRTAATVLQEHDEVIVAGVTYKVAPPTIATLILASRKIAELPNVELNGDNILSDVMRIAPDCEAIGDILAIMILGAKKYAKKRNKCRILHKLLRRKSLAETILEEMQPREVLQQTVRLMNNMQLADFFALTTSLIGINLLKPTKEVEKETTASGQ